MDNTKAINTISFFTGYGGIERGLKLAGERVNHIASCEIEAYAEANLIHKMETGALPPHPIWTDAKTFPGEQFLGKVDLFTGGFPCQPFSAAGSRNADEDPRHLWPACLKFIKEAQPNRVFLENVEGLISAKLGGDNWADPKGTPVLLHVLRELERRGYKATWGIFSAEEVGAPHRRKRVFILAQLADSEAMQCNGGNDDERELSGKIKVSQPRDHCRSGRGSIETPSLNNSQGTNSSSEFKGASEPKSLRNLQRGELAHSSSERLSRCSFTESINSKGWKEQVRHSSECSHVWPTRPGQQQGPMEEPRVKPKLGRATNGNSHRVDRLRLLGNGVVPQTAALAWLTLNERLEMGGEATQDGKELEIS